MTGASKMVRRRRRYDPQRLAAAERQVLALGWRQHGYTYAQIAAQAGYGSRQAAHKAVMSAIRRTMPKPSEMARCLELQRVDALFGAIYRAACGGDMAACSAAVELMAFRARLLGLDAPEQSQLFVAPHTTDAPGLLVMFQP